MDYGVPREHLLKPNQPCPVCGGEDRFSFYPKHEPPYWFCRKCGHGDPIALIMALTHLSFFKTIQDLRRRLGLPAMELSPQEQPKESVKEAPLVPGLSKAWSQFWLQSRPLTYLGDTDPVVAYLHRRGLKVPRETLSIRSHPGIPYWYLNTTTERWEVQGVYPAMLSLVTDEQGQSTLLHRTYLTQDGMKAPVESPKKLTAGENRGLIRVVEARGSKKLGLAEGIETAIAVKQRFGLPCWSTICVSGYSHFDVKQWGWPELEEVHIYADNDASYMGQAGAFECARRIKVARPALRVEVHCPKTVDTDWADYLEVIESEPVPTMTPVYKTYFERHPINANGDFEMFPFGFEP